MNLLQLPDDVLVSVMQYLNVEDLLNCRLVCKRLASLSLHWDSWRLRRIGDENSCLCAELHLAPCAERLVFSNRVHTKAYCATKCAAKELHLRILVPGAQGATCRRLGGLTAGPRYGYCQFEYALVLRQQLANGRLRSLILEADACSGGDIILQTLMSCNGLESLSVVGFASSKRIQRALPSQASLRFFRCQLDKNMDYFCSHILSSHCDTLERVDLEACEIHYIPCEDILKAITILPKLSKLSTLITTVFPGLLECLPACESLKDLLLYVQHHSIERAAQLLRLSSVKVSKLQLALEDECRIHNNATEDIMLQGLSWPEVRFLVLSNFIDMQAVIRALPRLAALLNLEVRLNIHSTQEFDVIGKIEDLLLGITPSTSPALQTLMVVDCRSGRKYQFSF